MFEMARSADFPTSSVLVVSRMPKARAASRVAPQMHSSTVSRNRVADIFIVSSNEVSGDVPGLQPVDCYPYTGHRAASGSVAC